MIHLGLIGYPLGHSLSPKLHNAALRQCDLHGEYSLFPIEPDDLQSLKELLERVRSGEITGLNVTIPHKQNVIPFLDQLTETAETIGAVNTIYLRNNKLIGANTDAPGFLADLKEFLTTHQPDLLSKSRAVQGETQRHGDSLDKNSLVLGAGGSARAVVYALLKDSWEVTIAARRIEQAQQLVALFTNYGLQIADFTLMNIELSNITLLVNTTPIGMAPDIDQSPWPENCPIPPQAAIYDLVYNPFETKFVKEAHAQGLSAITGRGMLIEQAALAFELWTGKQVSRKIMSSAMEAF
jgi:shikimate dehydrogenase